MYAAAAIPIHYRSTHTTQDDAMTAATLDHKPINYIPYYILLTIYKTYSKVHPW